MPTAGSFVIARSGGRNWISFGKIRGFVSGWDGNPAGRLSPAGAACRAEHESVICSGTARLLDYVEERRRAWKEFKRRLQRDAPEITLDAASMCMAVEIHIKEMTGRGWREGKRVYWKFRFQP